MEWEKVYLPEYLNGLFSLHKVRNYNYIKNGVLKSIRMMDNCVFTNITTLANLSIIF